MDKKEEWIDIDGYDGVYQISNLGRVKSLPRIVEYSDGRIQLTKEKMLKTGANPAGYLHVNLYINKKGKSHKIHKLVAVAFLGHKPGGYDLVVDHINNDVKDNRVENLRLLTNRENTTRGEVKGTSKYLGVSWSSNKNRWRASIRIKGKAKHLGYHKNEYDAHLAYQKALSNLYLE